MKIKLLVAIHDMDYLEHFSRVLSEEYTDLFEVGACSSKEMLTALQEKEHFDIALVDAALCDALKENKVRLPLLLESELSPCTKDCDWKTVKKYQRISRMTKAILGYYAEIAQSKQGGNGNSDIVVVWSPAGGCGKTTTALAYTAKCVAEGKKAVYLDLEPFSSTELYFGSKGKSISAVFEKLDGNVDLLLQSIREEDQSSGIYYFASPENYDDINVLDTDDLEVLVRGCAQSADVVVIDLANSCDKKVQFLFDMADTVLFVVDNSKVCQAKWKQFCTQHNVFGNVNTKAVLVANKGVQWKDSSISRIVTLPLLQSHDPVVIYKTLSNGYFSL